MIDKLKTKTKFFIKKIRGKIEHLNITAKCEKQWYGNEYGGFYVCPKLLNSDSIVYSFGIGEDISFDSAIINKHNCQVFGFDPTPKSIKWVESEPRSEQFQFYKYGISEQNGFTDFYLPKNKEHVSGSAITQKNVDLMRKVTVEMKSLTAITEMLGHQHIDVLKMDIEGSEYGVIENILNTKVAINQILIEFHDRLFEDGTARTKRAIKQLNRHGYELFGVSDSYEELSFVKGDLVTIKE